MLLQHHRIQALVSIVSLLLVGFSALHLKHSLVRGVTCCCSYHFSRYFSINSNSDKMDSDSWDQHQPTPTAIANEDIDCVAESNNRIMLESESILGRTNRNEVFTVDELISLQTSFRNLASLANLELNYEQLAGFAKRVAHLSFKQSFSRTEEAARDLRMILPMPTTVPFKQMFHRVLTDGGWDRAMQYASARSQLASEALTTTSQSSLDATAVAMKKKKSNKPWAVLVTGLNGIRKTTSINAPWFQTILYEALSTQLVHTDITIDDLPIGSNSFFRQLDYIVATIANSEFQRLYGLKDVKSYATLKNAIFARYRNLAEICGMLLIDTARDSSMNVLIESSGRDIAMFDYMNYCFPSDLYHRLVVHFTINDIQYAEKSVDRRMIAEMEAGRRSILSDDHATGGEGGGGVVAQIAANAGGPYGSSQLRSVQSDSDKVASLIFSGDSAAAAVAASGWFKASISITACDHGPWTIRANSSESSSQVFSFPESL